MKNHQAHLGVPKTRRFPEKSPSISVYSTAFRCACVVPKVIKTVTSNYMAQTIHFFSLLALGGAVKGKVSSPFVSGGRPSSSWTLVDLRGLKRKDLRGCWRCGGVACCDWLAKADLVTSSPGICPDP